MGHGATSSGKYYNGCTEADVNKGCYGKLSAEQIEERVDLHARRKLEGRPSIVEIAEHWLNKYGIEMSYQSEKQWCNTEDNAMLIDARQEELQRSGELARPSIPTQTLINSLAEAAKASAQNCKILRTKMKDAMDFDCTPWGLLGIAQDKYDNAMGPKRKELDARANLILKAKEKSLKLATDYCKAHIIMSREFRENVKQTYAMGKYLGILDAKNRRRKLSDAHRADIEDVTDKERVDATKLTEVDVDALRKSLGYEDNQG